MTGKLKFVPIAAFVMFPVSLIITYSMGVSYKHIRPFYSYISDTGARAPESCWFTLFLDLVGIVLGATAYIRYKQVEEYFRVKPAGIWMPRINVMGFIMGLVSGLGVTVVGAFQETTVFPGHVVGAFMSFLGGAIYFCFQAYFTFKMLPMFTNRCVAVLRAFIGVSCIGLFASTYICGVYSVLQFKGDDVVYWEPHDGGWTLRIISTVSEWVMAALFDLYILSFALDFSKLSFKAPQFKFIELKPTSGTHSSEQKFVQVRYEQSQSNV